MRGGGSKAVLNFFKNSSDSVKKSLDLSAFLWVLVYSPVESRTVNSLQKPHGLLSLVSNKYSSAKAWQTKEREEAGNTVNIN